MTLFPQEHGSLLERLILVLQCLFLLSGTIWATVQAHHKISEKVDLLKTKNRKKESSSWKLIASYILSIVGISYLTYYFIIKPFEPMGNIWEVPRLFPHALVIVLLTLGSFLFMFKSFKK